MIWLLLARGRGRPRLIFLAVSLAAPVLASKVGLQLRSPYDRGVVSEGLDTGVLVGVMLPICLLGSFLGEDSAWMTQQAMRPLILPRLLWGTVLTVGAAGIGCVAEVSAYGSVPQGILMTGALFLWGLTLLNAVVAGRQRSWMAPVVVAIVSSVPGALPLEWNVLMLGKYVALSGLIGAIMIVIGLVAYAVFDDWSLNRGHLRALDDTSMAD